jgi:hypothetical protein
MGLKKYLESLTVDELFITAPSGPVTRLKHDPQSGDTFSPDTPYTVSLDESWDRVLLTIYDFQIGNNPVDLRVNGDSGANYNYIQLDGGQTTGASQWDKITKSRGPLKVELVATSNAIGITAHGMGGVDFNSVHVGENRNVSGPITQFTLLSPASPEPTIEIIGADVA